MTVTYKNLYTQVKNLIDERVSYKTSYPYGTQQQHRDVAPFALQSSSGDVSLNSLVQAIMTIMKETIPPNILTGLEVEATSPISDQVIVRAGTGTSGGQVYELLEDTTITINFADTRAVYYINLHPNRIVVESSAEELTIAKIVVPKPGITCLIQDTADNGWNAYIQSFKEYKLYGFNDKFEEDTQALLRDNIGDILADNLIGNIRLSENLKITNTSGTLELDSNQMLFKSYNNVTLTKLNPNGIYFYSPTGYELAKFTTTGARIGNISITPTTLQSTNYVELTSGFRLKDDGDAEFNQLIVGGTIYGSGGSIGGWSITDNSIYATTTGTIKTSLNAGAGANGVVLDKDGLRVYDDVLGCVVNLPSDGSAPTFSSGTITSVIWEINTNSIMRTSETVGDGSANSAGLLINSTGLYGCEANQSLDNANFKILAADGSAYFRGMIDATSGNIGGVSIVEGTLQGGQIVGTTIIGSILETSVTIPRVRMDNLGIYYQVASNVGKYSQFKYGDGTHYGTGVLAFLFNTNYPVFAITAEHTLADIRMYNRASDPGVGSGPHETGDLICVDGDIKICNTAGSPGTFSMMYREDKEALGLTIENRTDDPVSPYVGQVWLRTDKAP